MSSVLFLSVRPHKKIFSFASPPLPDYLIFQEKILFVNLFYFDVLHAIFVLLDNFIFILIVPFADNLSCPVLPCHGCHINIFTHLEHQ